MNETASPSVAHEDLMSGDDDDMPETAASATPAAEPQKRTWQRWITDPKTKQRSQETYELLPYLRSVEDLWHRLCQGDIPLRNAVDDVDVWAGGAIKLLYLLSHQSFQYRHLRSQPDVFVEVIETWGNENVPREKTLDAVVLAMAIHNEAHREAEVAFGAAEPV